MCLDSNFPREFYRVRRQETKLSVKIIMVISNMKYVITHFVMKIMRLDVRFGAKVHSFVNLL